MTATRALHFFEEDELLVVIWKLLEIRLITELSSDTVSTPVPQPAPVRETMSALTEPLAGVTSSEPEGRIRVKPSSVIVTGDDDTNGMELELEPEPELDGMTSEMSEPELEPELDGMTMELEPELDGMTSEMSDEPAALAATPVNAETERATNDETRIRLRLFTRIIIPSRVKVVPDRRRPIPRGQLHGSATDHDSDANIIMTEPVHPGKYRYSSSGKMDDTALGNPRQSRDHCARVLRERPRVITTSPPDTPEAISAPASTEW